MEWVKKQTRTGSVYYYNVMTGSRRTRSPNEEDDDRSGSGGARAAVAPPPPPPPPRSTAIHNVFRVSDSFLLPVSTNHSTNQDLAWVIDATLTSQARRYTLGDSRGLCESWFRFKTPWPRYARLHIAPNSGPNINLAPTAWNNSERAGDGE